MPPSPPLSGIRVLELAGLAPAPFAGLILADFGADVLRVDRATPDAHTANPPSPTSDNLVRRKTSIALDLKSDGGVNLLKDLVRHIDVVIDPYRPGVLESMGLGPDILLELNPRLIVARLTGFRRDGPYSQIAGHDINYIAASGVLSLLGRAGENPHAPANLMADFAGGGAVCVLGILLALVAREKPGGKGQVVEANMVDGSAYLATFIRKSLGTPLWDQPRGKNVLDGGAPFYDTYETSDGQYMSVGALEPHFYSQLLKGLNLDSEDLPSQFDRASWHCLRDSFASKFKRHPRSHWEKIFAGTDACCVPVLTEDDLRQRGFKHRPIVHLNSTPSLPTSDEDAGEDSNTPGLSPGVGGEDMLQKWLGWRRDHHYVAYGGGIVPVDRSKL